MNDAIMSVMGGTLTAVSRAELLECNRISSYFGLILTPEQAEIISKHNTAALVSTGRVESARRCVQVPHHGLLRFSLYIP